MRKPGLYVVMTRTPHPDGEFVELEDECGRGVGPDSGVRWQRDGRYSLLGPFYRPPRSFRERLREAFTDAWQDVFANVPFAAGGFVLVSVASAPGWARVMTVVVLLGRAPIRVRGSA